MTKEEKNQRISAARNEWGYATVEGKPTPINWYLDLYWPTLLRDLINKAGDIAIEKVSDGIVLFMGEARMGKEDTLEAVVVTAWYRSFCE